MRGLLYKEFCIGRKTFLSFLALTLVIMLLGLLVCLSMLCGNLQEMAQDRQQVETIATIFTYLPLGVSVFAVEGVSSSIYGDYASKWMHYSYTLPTKAEKAVGVRYIMGGIVLVCSCLLGVINAVAVNALAGVEMKAELWKNMAFILLLAVLLLAFDVPMALKYRTARAVANRTVLVLAALYFIGGAKAVKLMAESEEVFEQYYQGVMEQFAGVRDIALICSPLIILVLLGISFFLAVTIYRRREG